MIPSDQNTLDDILSTFAKQFGLEKPTLSDNGYCNLESEHGQVIHLQLEPRQLMLMTELGTLPISRDREPLLEELLAANTFWQGTHGATLSFDSSSNSVLLGHRLPLDWLLDDGLGDHLEGFIHSANHWSERLQAAAMVQPADGSSPPADAGPPPGQYV